MKILAIDTSCDETACAVTDGTKVLSNIIWSQASLHAKFGGVMPSLAQRMHKERIDWIINKALVNGKCKMENLDGIAVTVGPGLAIALGVGIDRAKKLTIKYKKSLIAVNHVEAHMLSVFANPKSKIRNPKQILNSKFKFPVYGLVLSGGNTIFALIKEIGKYKVLAQTEDDALGEALDKGARMLGLGYPGGAILEKMARLRKTSARQTLYTLPVPIVGQEERRIFTYSGLKTAFSRLVESEKPLTKEKIYNLAASYQDIAFTHLIRVCSFVIENCKLKTENLLVGGGVAANVEVRKRIRAMCKKYGIRASFPYSNRLTGDNAAMVGVTAYLNPKVVDPRKIDRNANLKLGMI
jgi:N6-L-threonylcarbamoyladenine synthase